MPREVQAPGNFTQGREPKEDIFAPEEAIFSFESEIEIHNGNKDLMADDLRRIEFIQQTKQ